MKKIVFFSLLLIGVGLLFSPFLESAVIEAVKSSYILENYTAEQIADNAAEVDTAENIIEEDITVPELSDILQYTSDIDRDQVIGGIAIASVGLYQPIFYGTTKVSLLAGAGTMKSYQTMGKGNYCLAGHHMRDESLLFGPLLKVEIGDWIQLTDKIELFTYEVTQIEVVHQSDVGVLEDTGTPMITLITCDRTGVNTDYRLMVRGTLINISQVGDGNAGKQEENEYLEVFRYLERNRKGIGTGWLWLWIFVVCILAVILFGVGSEILKRSERCRQIELIKDDIKIESKEL